MNVLIQAWSCAPNRGGEFAVSWGWISRLDKALNEGDMIYVLSRGLKEEDILSANLQHVKLLKVTYPKILYKIFKESSITYILWQRFAYYVVKKTKIKFDIIHAYSLSDFRKPGLWYKFKDSYTIFGPVGGGQSCPKSLSSYDISNSWVRNIANIYCKYSLIYRHRIKKYNKCYACNYETTAILPKSEILPDVPLNDKLQKLSVPIKSNSKVILISCGRLVNKKGLLFLLDVLKCLPKGLEYELHIYGDGEQRDKIKNRVLELKLEQQVILMGAIPYDEMTNAYNKADIFILPSLRESGGSVLIEAMAHGLPIVSLNMALSKILAVHNVGLFVETSGSKEEVIRCFVVALQKLIEDPQLRVELGRNGYEYVNKELKWDVMFERVYGELLKN